MESISPFLWSHRYPCFGLLMMSALSFKVRVVSSFACFVTCVQWIPQIHLLCDTCWPLGAQHGGWAGFFISILAHVYTSIGGAQIWDHARLRQCATDRCAAKWAMPAGPERETFPLQNEAISFHTEPYCLLPMGGHLSVLLSAEKIP